MPIPTEPVGTQSRTSPATQNPRAKTALDVAGHVVTAAKYIPKEQLGIA